MKYFFVLMPFLVLQAARAQSKLPVIRATSEKVAINDGGYLDKNAWNLSPKTRPDIFTADRTRKAKWVTFYTDIDSIRVKVKPGTRYNFIVLLNGKDSCYTQIASAIPPEDTRQNKSIRNDTIPFTLTSFNAIKVKAVINDADTLNLHFDISSFDFHITRDAILKKTKLLSGQPANASPNYHHLNKASKLQMGSLVWHDQEILPTNLTAHEMDGRFGWNLFEGKVIEVDYDHNLLIIHSKLPKALKRYVRSKIEFIHSSAYIKGTFEVAGKKHTGDFSMDTGSEEAIILDSTWVGKQNFAANLELIKSSIIHDPTGAGYETKMVLAPLFKLNSFELTNIPTLILSSKINPMGFEMNYLGNDLMKRFNIILDFKNDYLYLKPNKLTDVKYKENS